MVERRGTLETIRNLQQTEQEKTSVETTFIGVLCNQIIEHKLSKQVISGDKDDPEIIIIRYKTTRN